MILITYPTFYINHNLNYVVSYWQFLKKTICTVLKDRGLHFKRDSKSVELKKYNYNGLMGSI